jgi:beta-1,2-mannobiose phosphorylase / 1,2-beta-oligomannan phosphorylase
MTMIMAQPLQMERLGVIMSPDPDDLREAWGTLNPGGARGPDGLYYLFPRVVAAGNYSRIGRARVSFDATTGDPVGVERLGYALEPSEPYELSPGAHGGGGVEDPRVTYIEPLSLYVMTYTAFTPPHDPRIALATSHDLVTWTRLGPVQYSTEHCVYDLNQCGNKDAVIFPEAVTGPDGPSLAILHRPTYAVRYYCDCWEILVPPSGHDHPQNIWISYVPLQHVQADIQALVHLDHSRVLMAPQAGWENLKVGAGAPPIRLPDGWLLLYHGVSGQRGRDESSVRYSAGAALLDLDDPTRIIYRSPDPILEPTEPYERHGTVSDVVFPTAFDRREDGRLDVYYGAADAAIGVARIDLHEAVETGFR